MTGVSIDVDIVLCEVAITVGVGMDGARLSVLLSTMIVSILGVPIVAFGV